MSLIRIDYDILIKMARQCFRESSPLIIMILMYDTTSDLRFAVEEKGCRSSKKPHKKPAPLQLNPQNSSPSITN